MKYLSRGFPDIGSSAKWPNLYWIEVVWNSIYTNKFKCVHKNEKKNNDPEQNVQGCQDIIVNICSHFSEYLLA